MLPIDFSKQYLPDLQSLLVMSNLLAYMYWYHSLPTHTYIPSNSFTPRPAQTILQTDEIHLNTRPKYLINLCLRHLIIPSHIIFKASLTPTPWYVHALLYHISIGNHESPPFGLFVLISSVIWAIFVVSSFHIWYPIYFLIFPIILLVGYWPNPLSDLDLRTASKITCKVLPGVDKDNYIQSEPKWSLFICIQLYYGKYHKWNISLFKRLRLTYLDGDITSSAIAQGSNFSPTGNTTQCTTVLFHCQNALSLIGVDVPRRDCFPPTLSYKHPITVRDAQVFIFIGVKFSSILIIKIIFLRRPFVGRRLKARSVRFIQFLFQVESFTSQIYTCINLLRKLQKLQNFT